MNTTLQLNEKKCDASDGHAVCHLLRYVLERLHISASLPCTPSNSPTTLLHQAVRLALPCRVRSFYSIIILFAANTRFACRWSC